MRNTSSTILVVAMGAVAKVRGTAEACARSANMELRMPYARSFPALRSKVWTSGRSAVSLPYGYRC